jgi:hypothetical protein
VHDRVAVLLDEILLVSKRNMNERQREIRNRNMNEKRIDSFED